MNLFLTSINEVLVRDLNLLEKEIGLYTSEEKLWLVDGAIKNTGGNLCLHLCGNLQHFIGSILGKNDYQRNRDFEFSGKDVARSELLNQIKKTKDVINQVVPSISDEMLEQNYPIQVFANKTVTTQFFLIHLATHLTYHLGQANYHRRLLDPS